MTWLSLRTPRVARAVAPLPPPPPNVTLMGWPGLYPLPPLVRVIPLTWPAAFTVYVPVAVVAPGMPEVGTEMVSAYVPGVKPWPTVVRVMR